MMEEHGVTKGDIFRRYVETYVGVLRRKIDRPKIEELIKAFNESEEKGMLFVKETEFDTATSQVVEVAISQMRKYHYVGVN